MEQIKLNEMFSKEKIETSFKMNQKNDSKIVENIESIGNDIDIFKFINVKNDYLTKEEADFYFEHALKELELDIHPPIKIFGKICHQNRDVGFFSKISQGYKYSGIIAHAKPLTPILEKIINKVNDDFKTDFNGILINRYMTGKDNIGPHSDSERELSKDGRVLCISLGTPRIFRLKHKKTNFKYEIETQHGQVLEMKEGCQKEFTHEIPIQNKIDKCRISLTFRKHES